MIKCYGKAEVDLPNKHLQLPFCTNRCQTFIDSVWSSHPLGRMFENFYLHFSWLVWRLLVDDAEAQTIKLKLFRIICQWTGSLGTLRQLYALTGLCDCFESFYSGGPVPGPKRLLASLVSAGLLLLHRDNIYIHMKPWCICCNCTVLHVWSM